MRSTPTRLIILSDLWGNSQSEWWPLYTSKLAPYFDLKIYDSCQLAGITPSNSEAERHQQFVNGGISRAAKALATQEQTENPPIVLGFSIGGSIAWEACLNHLKASHIFAISATRLRKQTQKPAAKFHLIYGDNDPYRPSEEWHNALDIKQRLIGNTRHELYRSPKMAEAICKKIIALNS